MAIPEAVELARSEALRVSEAVKAVCRAWGIPQEALSQRVGLSKNALARLSSTAVTVGKLAPLPTLDALALAYGTDRAGLLAGRGAPVAPYPEVIGERAPSRGVPRYVLLSADEAGAVRALFVGLCRKHREIAKAAKALGIGVETAINLREAKAGSRVNELVLERMATALGVSRADVLAGKAGASP